MPERDLERELQEAQARENPAGGNIERELQEQQPLVQRGEIREELAARFQFGWRTRFESLPGYMPEAIQSDYGLKLERNRNLNILKSRSLNYNNALPDEWNWRFQQHPGNLDPDGRPYNQYGDQLPYGAVEWTPQGNPSYRKEGESMLKGIWNKYWSTLTAPYGAEPGEGSQYKPTQQSNEDIQRLLKANVITKEEARKREAERAQMQSGIQDRIGIELSKETGEQADLATIVGRAPKAILNAWMQGIQLPAYETKRAFAVTEDLIYTAYKDLGLTMPYDQETILPGGMGVAESPSRTEAIRKQKEQEKIRWEAYFADAPVEIGDYFRDSYIDFNLTKLFTDKDLIEGGPLDASRQAGRIFYTGLLEPLTKAEYIRRYRDGEDPYMLQLELENPIAEAIGETIFDPLYVVAIAGKKIRDGVRLSNIMRKFLGQTKGIDVAIDAIKATQKGSFYPEAADVYKTAAVALGKDNVDALSRFTKFRDKTGLFVRTSAAKQHTMNRIAGEVFKGITSTTLDPQKQADAFRAIVLMSSSKADEIKHGLILASNFEMPRLLYSDAARQTGFMLRQMMRNEDGVIDTARFLKQLQGAQEAGVIALAKHAGKKMDDAIDELYPSVTKRLAATKDAQDALDAGKELTTKQAAALVDKIPPQTKAAAIFDASWFGAKKRAINNVFASVYMGYNPGWLSRNAQNNILTSVVDQGLSGLKYWHSEGALDNIASWVGKMDVEGFGGVTKLGIVDINDFKRADLPEEVQDLMNASEAIQSKLDDLGGYSYLGDAAQKKKGEALAQQLRSADYDLRNKMRSLGLTSADIGEAKAGFKYAERVEKWSGVNVTSAAVERSMLKMLKPGKAIPDVSQLIGAGMPEPLANHLVSTVIRKKGDIYGAVAEISNNIKKGESIFVMAGRSHLSDDVVRQLNDLRWMQHYDDIVIGGFVRGEPRDVVIKNFRAATLEGWDELATKVADDVVTLSDDIDGVERIRDAAVLAVKDKSLDEQHVARVFTYRGLNYQSNKDIRVALDKIRASTAATGDTAMVQSVDNMIAMFDQGSTELTVKHNQMLDTVLKSRGEKLSTPQEFIKEWNMLGLEGAPPANMTLEQFTDIRWRELYFEPTRRELAAARDVMYRDFQALLEEYPSSAIDQYFLDEVNKSYLRAVAYDPVLRADEIRLPLSAARKEERWDDFARILAHQYGIESVTYEAGRAIPNDVKVLNIINDNIGTDYVRLSDISEAELNEAFLRHGAAEYAQKYGIGIPEAPLAKAAEEVGEGVALPRMSDELRQFADDLDADFDPGFGERVVWDQTVEDMGKNGLLTTEADAVSFADEPPKGARVIHVGDGEEWHRQLVKDYDRDEGLGIIVEIDAEGMAFVDDPDIMAVDLPDGTIVPDSGIFLTNEEYISPDILKISKVKFGDDWHSVRVGEELPDEILEAYPGLREYIAGGWEAPAPRLAAEVAEAVPTRPFMPPIGDNTPLMQRMAAETRDGAADLVNRIETSIHDNWGKTMPNMDGDTKALLKELKTWADDGYTRIAEAKLLSRQVGYTARDWALHSYPEKYGFDIALSYIYPYEFWHTRTYAKWMGRAMTDPQVVATYARYRNTLEKIHAGAPDWWKYNINTNELLGIDSENPIFFNLESSLNPLYGMTGVDFNDPQKRVTWYATMVDNMSKWGPGMWTVWNWAVAGALAIEGETEAAKRWAGRLTPQSRMIKAALSLVGINISKDDFPLMQEGINEFDPMVLAFQKGIDPYEYQRVVVELGGMVDNDEITGVEMIDAFMSAEGENWNLAHERAIRRRAPGDISSFMLGVGFKGRNKTDQDIDIFYRDLFRVMGNKDTLSPEEYRDSISELFKDREWGQGLLIGRKRGYARDEALAYNVLARIQPGQLDNILKDTEGIGVTYDMVQQFYATKGDSLYEWNETDRTGFMNAIMVMQSVIDLPTDATKETWQLAKDANQRMYTAMEAWRPGIQDAISGYYAVAAEGDLKGWTQAQIFDAQQAYLDDHPYVETVMDNMSSWKLRDPDMAPYYASIEGMERYYNNLVWTTLEAELGAGIFDEWNDYHNKMLVWDGQITQFEQLNPHVLSIKARRTALAEAADAQIAAFELANPYVLEISQAYTDMWEKRTWAVYNAAGSTLDKLWSGYWAIPEQNKAERRAYYKENETALELGASLKEEGLAHIKEMYSPELIAQYEQWNTMTNDRWDLYNFGYKDVLINEGVTQEQFADYDTYNDLFKRKNEERDAVFAASKGLSRYSEVKRELNQLAATQMAKAQGLLPTGPGTRLREDVGAFGTLQQNLYDTISGYTGRNTYYGYSWQDWQAQIDDPVMNLIEDYIVDGLDPPEALYDNLQYVADNLGILTPELLFEMIQNSYR